MDKYIKMLLYKLKGKDSNIKLTTIYSLFYDGQYEQYFDKKSLLDRMIEIDKELRWGS